MGPGDVDVACMYDCFTYTVMATVEDDEARIVDLPGGSYHVPVVGALS